MLTSKKVVMRAERAGGGASLVQGGQEHQQGPLSAGEYVAQFKPRVNGLAYTAPVYDKVTQPVRAPYPAACVQSKNRCQCYTQQGTKLETDKALCEGIVAGGFFMAWDENRGQMAPIALPAVRPAGDVQPLPVYIELTPGHQGKGTQVASADQDEQDGGHQGCAS